MRSMSDKGTVLVIDDEEVMREILETLLEWRHPLSIVTKSALILRDKELLVELAKLQLVTVHVSVTTLDVELKTRLEPRTAGPSARLKVIRELSDAGVPVGVLVAPRWRHIVCRRACLAPC